jgi:predicted nucleotidyltransferase
MGSLSKREKDLILEFKKRLSAELKEHLKQLIIFGSRVKGEAYEDSDLDVIALVDEKNHEIEKQFEDIAYQVMWDNDFKPIISLKVFSESHFNDSLRKGFSFFKHIKEEGISI